MLPTDFFLSHRTNEVRSPDKRGFFKHIRTSVSRLPKHISGLGRACNMKVCAVVSKSPSLLLPLLHVIIPSFLAPQHIYDLETSEEFFVSLSRIEQGLVLLLLGPD
jgi:hypothetical protein